MQLLSHPFLLGAATTLPVHPRFQEFFQREEVRHLAAAFALMVVVCQVFNILGLWLASKVLIRAEEATLLNALKVWAWEIILGFVANFVVGFVVMLSGVMEDPTRLQLLVGGAALCALLMMIVIPMKIYVIGLFRAVCLLLFMAIISAILLGGAGAVAYRKFGWDKQIAAVQAAFGKTKEEQQSFLGRLAGREAPDEIDRLLDDALRPVGPQPSLQEREATVATLQKKLQARRATLEPGTPGTPPPPPPPDFQSRLDRYLQFLKEVKAEREAQPESPPAAPAPPAPSTFFHHQPITHSLNSAVA